ncbi:MAG TPA: 2-isopropylmalate synthase [Alphaproteobacteria bacterium]|jgi:2-isopropylmalate synthase|nr:2-isopropylmalate synthase [Alphaproteobacteria bacterium]
MTSTDADRIFIFDTTMRDGEQSPGASMTLEEKLRLAEILEAMGVDIIEAGFPIASNGDFECVNEVAKMVKEAIVCGLARSGLKDVDRAAEALAPAARKRIHTFVATSPLHMKYKLQMEPEEVHQGIIDSVTRARDHCDDVEWSSEDGTRTEHDFLCRCIESAIKAGAGTINIPDTVGYALPDEYEALIRMVRERVPNSDKARFSVHCHNDLGLAVANSLAGIKGGAQQVECTINGLGERAGNAAMEEIVMALRTRHDLTQKTTAIKTEDIMLASRTVSAITGFAVQNNKAIVGANAFAHEAGIHQDGMLKHAGTYEIMTPESVGLKQSTLVMGKHSGRHAFREKLNELGFTVGDNQLQDAFRRFKDLADKKKDVYDEDIIALVDDEARVNDFVNFVSLQVICGSIGPQTAELEIEVDGSTRQTKATGDGPVDATFNAIKELVPHSATLQLYQVNAVTEGTDAQAGVTVRLADEDRTANGQGADTDTLVASARAYINALNKLMTNKGSSAPAALSA